MEGDQAQDGDNLIESRLHFAGRFFANRSLRSANGE